MMDEFIHYPKPYLLLSTTCDKILLWVIEIWMTNDLVNDSNCNILIQSPPLKKLQGLTNIFGLTFSVGDTILRFTIRNEQDNWNW